MNWLVLGGATFCENFVFEVNVRLKKIKFDCKSAFAGFKKNYETLFSLSMTICCFRNHMFSKSSVVFEMSIFRWLRGGVGWRLSSTSLPGGNQVDGLPPVSK